MRKVSELLESRNVRIVPYSGVLWTDTSFREDGGGFNDAQAWSTGYDSADYKEKNQSAKSFSKERKKDTMGHVPR